LADVFKDDGIDHALLQHVIMHAQFHRKLNRSGALASHDVNGRAILKL